MLVGYQAISITSAALWAGAAILALASLARGSEPGHAHSAPDAHEPHLHGELHGAADFGYHGGHPQANGAQGHAHGHSHGHAHRHFDFIEPYESHGRGAHGSHGHAGHTSVEGYPFVHGIRTEIDFVERAMEFDLVRSDGADGGTVDELEFESELVWALNSRMILIVGAPLISLDPIDEPYTTGPGDMEVGFQFLAFGGQRDLLFFALNATFPTGDDDRDLGNGYTTLAPTALWLHDFGGGSYIQNRWAIEVPVSTRDVGNDLTYDCSLCHCFVNSEDWAYFRFLTALFEVNGVSTLNHPDSGRTVVDLTPGVRWIVREMDEVGIGWSFPVTGDQNFSNQLIFSYRLHF